MSLIALQRDFRRWLLTGAGDAGAGLPGATEAGLAVYQNNYRAQLAGCLQASYPLLRAFMGEEAFLHAAAAHIKEYPPHAWTLDAYADGFESTLERLFPSNPDLHELAWIEHAMGAAFVAPDARALEGADFAGADWNTLRLRLTPSLRLRRLSTNAAELWRTLGDGGALDGEMLAEPGSAIVWRSGYQARLRTGDALEHEALAAMLEHGSFDALCLLLVERLGETHGVARAGALLADWIAGGLVVGFGAQART